ncbi:hypothetical protein THRCLA_02902 [Thraustotheca clavata]|uniref:CUE domain-containing protein n=1 Tax=Thraustotheca clavata TaxID=74557 RepID=A0A1W0A3Q7_9STRA|nr:hypothetical protein THRCLA_02902 [Thraustotheca clavata]
MTAKALLSVENSVFLRSFTNDLKFSAWVFGEMKSLVKKIATKQAFSSDLATNLLTIVVRVLAAEPHEVQLDQLAQRGVFSVARILVMCSLYAPSNRQAMEWCMERLFQCAPVLKDQITMVIPMFTQVLVDIHQKVNMLKAHDEIAKELLDHIADTTHSINAMTRCSPTILEMLTPQGETIQHAFNGNTLLYAIFVCYECDLPMLSSLNSENEVWQQSIGKVRSYCLNLLDTWMEHHLLSVLRMGSSQSEEACENLFGVIDILLHGNNAPAIMTDNGTFLSDYNQLYNFKAACKLAFQQAQIDEARGDYLVLMLDKLPLRPSGKQQKPEKQPEQSQVSDDEKLLHAISQVQEVFPDLGDGFLELCIKAYNYQAEQAIMGLLEENLPEAIAPLDRSLRKTDAAYKEIVNPKSKAILKSDQIWVGKKKQPEAYKPESAKENAEYAAKTQALIMSYDEEPPLWLDAPTNEYNDDYNDELEDYTPFSANDEMDYEEIKARNKLVRAQEAEDEYWESMRNRNHSAQEESNESNDDDEQVKKEEEKRSIGRNMTTAKNGAIVAEDKTASNDAKKQNKNRARKEHNKAKVGNHNRKDGARRKQAKGMI